MIHFFDDKVFLSKSYSFCAGLVNQLVQELKHYEIESKMMVVGSKKRNMITQNANGPIDYDFNLIIVEYPYNDGWRELKPQVIEAFNYVLNRNDLPNCNDSTSVITSKEMQLKSGNKTKFKIDICIVRIDAQGYWNRLIHDKSVYGRYFWNRGPSSSELQLKEQRLKQHPEYWNEVRNSYLDKKNLYLCRQDYNHPSFICYTEAVNDVYNKHYGSTFRNTSIYKNLWYNMPT
jgi:hypothetical protein